MVDATEPPVPTPTAEPLPPKPVLTHFRLCPHSRSIRLALHELTVDADLVEEKPWEWRPAFLALNPAGELPVLTLDQGTTLCGTYAISEYLAETAARPADDPAAVSLFPGDASARGEVRRLVDWFHGKFYREVTRNLLGEKLYARMTPDGEHAPDVELLRAARANMRYHLSYVSFLANQRSWLAGETLSFADLAAGGQLSVIDYLGDIPWTDYPAAKLWYAKLKSRPSFRSILADRLAGTPPPPSYADLDF